MKRSAWILLALLLAAPILGGAHASEPWDITKDLYEAGSIETTDAERDSGNPIFVITLANGNTMRGELYPDIAPQSVGNFVALANSGFYDGLIFHRVIPGFVIQGGCPLGIGTGDPGWSIKGEFRANGVENGLNHNYGVLSMARSSQFDSAGSQFFVMVTKGYPTLDGQYAAFGLVTEGMEYAEEIVNTPRDARDKPLLPQMMRSVRVETFGKEYPFDQM